MAYLLYDFYYKFVKYFSNGGRYTHHFKQCLLCDQPRRKIKQLFDRKSSLTIYKMYEAFYCLQKGLTIVNS